MKRVQESTAGAGENGETPHPFLSFFNSATPKAIGCNLNRCLLFQESNVTTHKIYIYTFTLFVCTELGEDDL